MVAKFQNDQKIIEADKVDNGVSFFVYEFGEEQVGQEIVLTTKETHELLKYLQGITNYPQPTILTKN
jgi:hypothetical protein